MRPTDMAPASFSDWFQEEAAERSGARY